MPEVGPPRATLPSALEDQFKPSVRLLPQEDPYLARFQHGHPARMIEPYSMLDQVVTAQQEWYRTDSTHGMCLSNYMEHQGLPARTDPYYAPENQRRYWYVAEDTTHIVRTNIPGIGLYRRLSLVTDSLAQRGNIIDYPRTGRENSLRSGTMLPDTTTQLLQRPMFHYPCIAMSRWLPGMFLFPPIIPLQGPGSYVADPGKVRDNGLTIET
ncbi:hypothetical protein Acr_19g0009730 [Actinidia rufa]|uniref:Uncharacterized protein n=1 Tax=Actinidia rufa TaxID=165716 RepID=A0A7J0GB50_9ERIC|nr:hypothetical protein Acr_19g0009730 [Actinidia rufa]